MTLDSARNSFLVRAISAIPGLYCALPNSAVRHSRNTEAAETPEAAQILIDKEELNSSADAHVDDKVEFERRGVRLVDARRRPCAQLKTRKLVVLLER